MLARIVAFLLGALALLVTAVFTAGGTLGAFLGVVIASIIAIRRRRGLTRPASWLGAVVGCAVVLAAVGGLTYASLPSGTYAQMKRAGDSVSAVAKPPAWLDRIAPGASAGIARQSKPKTGLQRAFAMWSSVIGVMLALTFISALVGTVGWLVTLPLAYAWRGVWLPWEDEPLATGSPE